MLDTSRLGVFCQKNHVERLTDCDAYFEQTHEYYFERSPLIFEYVVDFYITGVSISSLAKLQVAKTQILQVRQFWKKKIRI